MAVLAFAVLMPAPGGSWGGGWADPVKLFLAPHESVVGRVAFTTGTPDSLRVVAACSDLAGRTHVWDSDRRHLTRRTRWLRRRRPITVIDEAIRVAYPAIRLEELRRVQMTVADSGPAPKSATIARPVSSASGTMRAPIVHRRDVQAFVDELRAAGLSPSTVLRLHRAQRREDDVQHLRPPHAG